MELTTRIDIPKSKEHISHNHKLLLLGSCFADEIGERLRRDQFDALVNPFGTLYNPASICAHLLRCLSEREYDVHSPELIEAEGVWHSFMHHTSFSATTRDELVSRMNSALHTTAERLRTAQWLMVTFGTSFVYRLQSSGMLVSNCHKQPDALFLRQRLPAVDIVDMWRTALQMLRAVNPGLNVLFTVSPIRHKRDGLHQNNISKAELLIAVEALGEPYFPAYEILLDELRDYRFYGDDLVHPSHLAADIIYERFTETFVTKEDMDIIREVRRQTKRNQHRTLLRDK